MSKIEAIEEPYESLKEDHKVIKEAKAIALGCNGLQPLNHIELKTVIQTIAEGGGFPKRFDTLPKQVAAFNLARALMGDRWQIALNNIAVIQGQMMIYGELPRLLAEQTNEVKQFKVYAIDKHYKEICTENKNLDEPIYAGICEVQRSERTKNQYSYTIKEAEKAGQYPPTKWDYKLNKSISNPDSPWEKYTKIMLLRKAQALGVKFEFPDALAGAPIAEYEQDVLPDYIQIKDLNNIDKAKLINEKFSSQAPPESIPAEGIQK